MAQPIGLILQQWADLGIFYYVLPGMLVFALVFAILQKAKIFGADDKSSKGINAVIAGAVALMSLQFDAVPVFFQIIFPKVGIGLSIILAAMILVGLFVDFEKSGKRTGAATIFFGIGGIIFIVILLQSLSDYSWWTGSWWQENISAIVAGIILIVFISIVVNSGSSAKTPFPHRIYDGTQ